ncbi:MAG: PQQ-dependent sugar dehydrogenase [Anaerolineales bacterium]|nr:PQQ-dependent sugar dehydrogenase [Anaerolineales bacterium]
MQARILWATLFIPLTFMIFTTNGRGAAAPLGEYPYGFEESTVVSGLEFPVDMAILPTGDHMLVVEKGSGEADNSLADVVLIENFTAAEPTITTILTLSTTAGEGSGVQSVVPDPNFANNGYFYVYYQTGREAQSYDGEPRNRLSRFTLLANKTVVPHSELILFETVWDAVHNGGGMAFDNSGRLLFAIGELGYFRSEVQELNSYRGKVLRIQPTETGYTIPADNPFLNVPGALPEIYALGVRSPFKITKESHTGRLYLADVGHAHWEEVNELKRGANYGWPVREGPCPISTYTPCAAAPAAYTDPLLYYPHHDTYGGALTGVAFYEGVTFPEDYHEALFMADFNTTELSAAHLTDGSIDLGNFALSTNRIVDLEYHDEGLYFLDIYDGRIGRITYTGEPTAPSATLTADTVFGPPDLTVTFTAADISNPSGTELTYYWNFGGGMGEATTTEPTVTHTYTAEGNYTPWLQIVDENGRRSNISVLEITVYEGDLPQITLTNLTNPELTDYYHAGDTIEYAVVPPQDVNLDPFAPYSWLIELRHNVHAHPAVVYYKAVKGILNISSEDHGDIDIWYRFILTMNTAQGVKVTVTKEIFPAYSQLTFKGAETIPFTPDITVSGIQHTLPYSYTAIVGTEYPVVNLTPTYVTGHTAEQTGYLFSGWNNQPNTSNLFMLTAPAVDTTYTADYQTITLNYFSQLPLIRKK